jgi:hypothetical protein
LLYADISDEMMQVGVSDGLGEKSIVLSLSAKVGSVVEKRFYLPLNGLEITKKSLYYFVQV